MNACMHISSTLLVATMLAVTVAACGGEERPDYVLSESRMADVLVDYHLAKAIGESGGIESEETPYYVLSAFQKNHITEAQFDSTLAWYSARPQQMDEIYSRVCERLQRERDGVHRLLMARDNSSGGTVRGDRVDVWQGLPMFSLNGSEYNDRVTFNFTNDRNFEGRDTLRLSARFRFFDDSAERAAVMAMSIHYKNDSVIGRSITVNNDGTQTLQLFSDTLGDIREVNGFIYYPGKSAGIVLVDRVSLMRLHAKSQAR